jgi:predicted transcriptional regulator
MRISEVQRKIAVLLLVEPKTIEEINKQLDLGFDVLTQEVNTMLKMGLVNKTKEYPTRYVLDDYIISELKKRKEIAEKDSYKIKVQMILDIDGVVKEIVDKHLDNIKIMLEKEKDITIYDIKKSDLLEQDNSYFGYIDITCTVKDFATLVRVIMFYCPSSIEVLAPTKYDISMYELQDGLIELSHRTQNYIKELQKRLTREEAQLAMQKFYTKQQEQ